YKQRPKRNPIPFKKLKEAFKKACDKYSNEADKVISFLNNNIRNKIEHDFGIGWGPRLEKQIKNYVPVICASGGNEAEATDRILSMRILRKVRKRHDLHEKTLCDFLKLIKEKWSLLGSKGDPELSNNLLEKEIKRLEPEGEHGY
ncbi:hypothetical protein ACFL35_22065, partial [Candidatus Riflebacteria bacterium]